MPFARLCLLATVVVGCGLFPHELAMSFDLAVRNTSGSEAFVFVRGSTDSREWGVFVVPSDNVDHWAPIQQLAQGLAINSIIPGRVVLLDQNCGKRQQFDIADGGTHRLTVDASGVGALAASGDSRGPADLRRVTTCAFTDAPPTSGVQETPTIGSPGSIGPSVPVPGYGQTADACSLVPVADIERAYGTTVRLTSEAEARGTCFGYIGQNEFQLQVAIDAGPKWACAALQGAYEPIGDVGDAACWNTRFIQACAKGWTLKVDLPLVPPLPVDLEMSALRKIDIAISKAIVAALPDRNVSVCLGRPEPPAPSPSS
jgi:hypothetical protein